LNLELYEDNGEIVFIPVGGSNLIHWVNRLEELNIPEFHLFDRDSPPELTPKYQRAVDLINDRPSCTARLTNKKEIEKYLHPTAIRTARPTVNITFEDFDSVPRLAAKAIHESSESPNSWESLTPEQQDEKASNAKKWLNQDAVKFMTPELLAISDSGNDLFSWLNEISQLINRTDSSNAVSGIPS
jgi:putative ATP-dependent endonuclease of the OLD family